MKAHGTVTKGSNLLLRVAADQTRAAFACIAIVAVLIAALPICAHAWSSGTDSAEMADTVAAFLEVKPGSVIAEVGAGHGYMAVRMAEKVGLGGRLYATEIDADDLAEISSRAGDDGLANVTVVKATDTETGLKAACCDAIFMTDVYHHFADPIATDKSIFAALKPGGRLFISDFYPTWIFSFWTTAAMRRNFGGHGVAEPLLVSQLTSVGFKVVEEIPGYPPKWPSGSYSVVLQKPAEPAGAQGVMAP